MTRTFRFSVWLYLGLALLAFPAALSEGNAESLPESQEQGDGHVRRLQESEPEDVNEKAAAEGETPSDEPNDVLEETDEQDEDGGSSEDEEEQFYFYFDLPDTPIIEYVLAPEENVWAHHEFLLKPDPNSHRIVEFYAHWCPHVSRLEVQVL